LTDRSLADLMADLSECVLEILTRLPWLKWLTAESRGDWRVPVAARQTAIALDKRRSGVARHVCKRGASKLAFAEKCMADLI
jgi:hypothetical protein